MRIRFRIDGGLAFLPGLAAPIEIDTDSLPPADRSAWEARLSEVRFFDRPAPSPSDRARDQRAYEISVEQADRRRTLRVSDPIPADFRALVDPLREIAGVRVPPPNR